MVRTNLDPERTEVMSSYLDCNHGVFTPPLFAVDASGRVVWSRAEEGRAEGYSTVCRSCWSVIRVDRASNIAICRTCGFNGCYEDPLKTCLHEDGDKIDSYKLGPFTVSRCPPTSEEESAASAVATRPSM